MSRPLMLHAAAQTLSDTHATSRDSNLIAMFLCGDVMTGRGIDQVLPHPVNPRIHEPYMKSALGYVELAEAAHGGIPRPVSFAYVWGDALAELKRANVDARIVNLETAVTKSDDAAPKGINYRMSPENVACLNAASIDCCVLANNHVLDWGQQGLLETLETLQRANLRPTGAGRDAQQAARPTILDLGQKGRVIVFAFGSTSSGIPRSWAARPNAAGVNLLLDLSRERAVQIAAAVRAVKRPRDVVVVSIHWGGNWGYRIDPGHQRFAHWLVDFAQVDVIHGHSSHHAKAVEVYKDKLILYGCGDLLNDYEGIRGREQYRNDLALMYLAGLEPSTGKLARLELVPLRIRKFRLGYPSNDDVRWMRSVLDREGAPFGTSVTPAGPHRLVLSWH